MSAGFTYSVWSYVCKVSKMVTRTRTIRIDWRNSFFVITVPYHNVEYYSGVFWILGLDFPTVFVIQCHLVVLLDLLSLNQCQRIRVSLRDNKAYLFEEPAYTFNPVSTVRFVQVSSDSQLSPKATRVCSLLAFSMFARVVWLT